MFFSKSHKKIIVLLEFEPLWGGGDPWTTKKDFFLRKKNGRKEPEKYVKGGGQGLLQSKKYRFSNYVIFIHKKSKINFARIIF